MINEIRNELLGILNYARQEQQEDQKLALEMLLERFEYDIKDQLKDIEYKKEQLENNLETLKYVREQLYIESGE